MYCDVEILLQSDVTKAKDHTIGRLRQERPDLKEDEMTPKFKDLPVSPSKNQSYFAPAVYPRPPYYVPQGPAAPQPQYYHPVYPPQTLPQQPYQQGWPHAWNQTLPQYPPAQQPPAQPPAPYGPPTYPYTYPDQYPRGNYPQASSMANPWTQAPKPTPTTYQPNCYYGSYAAPQPANPVNHRETYAQHREIYAQHRETYAQHRETYPQQAAKQCYAQQSYAFPSYGGAAPAYIPPPSGNHAQTYNYNGYNNGYNGTYPMYQM
jgi:hypothetical protein